MRLIAWIFGFTILVTPMVAHAQRWSGIVSPSRAMDWSTPGAGVAGGISNRTTVCATLNPGATTAQISSAIAACPSGQVVFLNAGTYNVSGSIQFGTKNNVTLRGAGADSTRLVFSSGGNCTGVPSVICIASTWINTQGSPQNVANWTAGYAKGSTVITLSTTAGMAIGNTLIVDQLDDTTDGGSIYVCSTALVCSFAGGNATGRPNRGQQQLVKVVAINGSQVTIGAPVHMPNWRASQSPQAIWVNDQRVGDGVEDLSIDMVAAAGANGVVLLNATDSWVKGIRSIGANRSHIWVYQSTRITARDNYLWGNQAGVSQSYGLEIYGTSDVLAENNMFQHVTAPITVNGTDSGSVYAYNFSYDNFRSDVPIHMSSTAHLHEVGTAMLLFEGNDGLGFISDNWHGTSHFVTNFRNHWYGDIYNNPPKTQNTDLMHICAYSRFFNFVGNVLGRVGYYTVYESPLAIGDGPTNIWSIGATCANGGVTDALVKPNMMRWGNYDTVTGATQFAAVEVPSGAAQYANPVPASQSLPPSFYLSAKPAWFGAIPWPPIGPDVTGGQHTGGHAYKIPARVCWEQTAIDPAYGSANIRLFNRNTCYGQPTGTRPSSPSNLTVQ